MKTLILVAIAIASSLAPCAAAELGPGTTTFPLGTQRIPVSGADLAAIISDCRVAKTQAIEKRACQGFQAGAITGAMTTAAVLGIPAPICPPADIRDDDVDAVILRSLEKKPERAAMAASFAAIAAMAEAYPCPIPEREAKPR
jgi:uncharacterized protein involved in high-affinity Fe2+ transport